MSAIKSFYDKPTQVSFVSPEAEEGVRDYGIAIGGVIICACCGATWEIEDLIEAEKDGYNFRFSEYEGWASFYEIMEEGDEYYVR